MSSQAMIYAPQQAPASPVPASALDSLAARIRPNGLFLVMLNTEGTVTYHDSAAGVFFLRYVLPLLQYGDIAADEIRAKAKSLSTAGSVSVWNDLPGVTIAAFPYLEKRTQLGVLLIAGKGNSFSLDEDVLRVCSRLGLDGTWLSQQAGELTAYGEQAIQRQGRLATSMLRDQVRLNSLETELDSLSGQLANTYEELSLIYQLSSGMKINRRASDFFKQACLDVMDVMSVRGMGVALRADAAQRQEPVLYGGLSLPPGQVHRLADELMAVLNARKAPILTNNLAGDKTLSWMAQYATELLAVPLMRQEQILGCLFAIDKCTGEFDTVDSKLLNSIANESAIYLENAMLFDDVRGLMMGLLHSLTSAVDAKDAYTCGHSERVALLSRYLAQQAGLTEHQVDRIYMAGLLHDVGKIGVPEAVLKKSGKLTDEEFEEIKKHPEIGAKILRDVKQIEDLIPGVLHHHERYDGRGYPAKLAGENIPLMGRLICLADCFDAMTSSRTYRKAMPVEDALAEIRRCSGTQFDPKLSEAFLSIGVQKFHELVSNHQEQSKKLIDAQQMLRT